LLFIIDDTFSYEVFKNDVYVETVTFTVKMNALGEFFLADAKENKLYFNSTPTQFYFYHYEGDDSYLKYLFIVAPRFPFINKRDITFEDCLPINLVKSKMEVLWIELISTIQKKFSRLPRVFVSQNNRLESEEGYVGLEAMKKGFYTIVYHDIELRRTDDTVVTIK
jgi:hypothetical protein